MVTENIKTEKEWIVEYRHALRRILKRIGIPSNPAVTDDWILLQIGLAFERMEVDPYNQYTYVVEHQPNCPSPYLVRMVGRSNGATVIDKLPVHEKTRDVYGYGQTFREAAEKALIEHLKPRPNQK